MRKIMYHIILCSTSMFFKSAKFVFFADLKISMHYNKECTGSFFIHE